jgi:hypothetical protein
VKLRRNLLLTVLSVLLAFVAYDHWPEQQPVDLATFSVLELMEKGTWDCLVEIQKRARQRGPEAVEELLSHDDVSVRSRAVFFLGLSGRNDVVPGVIGRWRTRLLRMIAEDSSKEVQNQAVLSLGFVVRDDLDGPVPPALLDGVRKMLKSDDRDRFFACLLMMQLGERVAVLRDDLLKMDVSPGSRDVNLWMYACDVLGKFGAVDDEVRRYLLHALQSEQPMTRSAAAGALGRLQASTEVVVEQLAVCVEDEAPEVRAAALAAFGRIASPADAYRFLGVALQSRDAFAETGQADWLECVVDLTLRAETSIARAVTVDALVGFGESTDDYMPDFAIAGALGRIAIAGRDSELLDQVLATLMAELDRVLDSWEEGSVLMWEAEYRLAFGALVDLCLWRKDPTMVAEVRRALQSIEATELSWIRVWCREQLARLDW